MLEQFFNTQEWCVYFWFFFSFLCIFFELISPGLFYFLSCGFSAFIVAIIDTFFNTSVFVQGIVFFLIFVLLFFVLKIFVTDRFNEKKSQYKSHLLTLIAQEGIVVMQIQDDIPGQVRIKNEVWLAYSCVPGNIIIGRRIIVIAVRGAHLVVRSV
jgi:membrane protein implicated in regulation of membrane protease activity